MGEFGKLLAIIGVLITVAGLLLWAAGGKGWFQWLGRLPGDIRINKGNFGFYFPIVTCLLISVVLTLVLSLVSRFWRK